MKHRGATAWLASSGALFGWALAAGSDMIAMLSFGAAGVGLTLLAPAAKRLLVSPSTDAAELESRLRDVEARLKTTEAELESATIELAQLRDEQAFDRQLLSAQKTVKSPHSSE